MAWVTVAVVTRPMRALLALPRMAAMGVISLPEVSTLIAPLFTRWPPPQAEDAAAESVTIEFAEAVSISPREAVRSLKMDHHCVPFWRVSFE